MSTATSEELAAKVAGQTVASAFLGAVQRVGAATALRWKEGEQWRSLNWLDYADRVARVAAGLRALGVGPGDRVMLMVRNIPEFHVLDTAAYFCGATPISIYNSSSREQIRYLANHSHAVIGVVEDEGFARRWVEVRADLTGLRGLGVVRGAADFNYDDLLSHTPIDLVAAAASIDPSQLATVIYTSGTTGPPKGVMLTHQNVAWTVESLRRSIARDDLAGKRVISYLPMAHIAERITSHYQGMFFGLEVVTCPDPSLLAPYCREVRPEILFGVPRVWEKFYSGITASLSADPDRSAKFNAGVEAASPIVEARTDGRATAEQEATLEFLDAAAFAPLRELLGFDALICAVTGAAPIPRELLSWFRAIGVPLSEIYGLSETSGPMTWDPWKVRPGTVGRAIPGCEVRLADDREVLCRGGNVFAGYLDDPEKTAESIDSEGFLHSGDIGEFDGDGYLRIVDRKKELIITASGKNISPANLEAKLKLVPLIGQAAVVGDARPFMSALVVLEPDAAAAFAAREGITYASVSDLVGEQKVIEAVAAGIDEVMREFNNAERVKKWTILGDEWLPDSDELTPTSKLKRRIIVEKYAADIEAMYR
ncbi:MAG TPA: AMP-dependent synthetase/ligase [Acidimicrobiales bacterium]|nr:AMP-dependent synthetase/ligase [Acidimicrobiales bacterium]